MKTSATKTQRRKLPAWCGWLFGYLGLWVFSAGLVYYWRVIFDLSALPALPLTAGVAGVLSLLYLGAFLLCRYGLENLCRSAALAVFALGLLFCFATAPLQAPDETSHYLRAYAVSQGHFDYNGGRGYPEDVDHLAEQFDGFMNHRVTYQNGQLAPSSFSAYFAAVEGGAPAGLSQTEPVMFVTLPYLLQGLFMAVARGMGFGALGLLYAGRIANLALYALIAYFTFKNCDRYRGLFIAVVMLPLSLFMAASCSYDAIVLALCYFLVSFFCKAEVRNLDLVVFLLALMLITYLKLVNVVLAAVLLLVPKDRWKSRLNPWLVVGAAAALALLFWRGLGWVDGGLLASGYPEELARGSGEAAAPGAQLVYMLTNPLRFMAVAVQSFLEQSGFLFNLGTFGWLDLAIPVAGGLSVLSLCAAAALGIQRRTDTKWTGGFGLFLAALLYSAAVLVGMYLLDSDLYAIRISGPQPRYFLPALLMVFMVASIVLGKVVRPALPEGALGAGRAERVALLIAALVALLAAILLFQNYFIGQWIPKAEGGYKLVNLLGWQIK